MVVFNVVVPCVILLVAYYTISRWRRSNELAAFAATNGCMPPQKHLHNLWWPPLGLDKTVPTIKADRAGRLPAFMLQEFEKHGGDGHTYTQWLPNQYVILTRSPANIETVCKTRFKDYEIGIDRTGNFRPLLEHGVLALDGPAWVKSRAMLRPHFTRNTDNDFLELEVHVQHLLRLLSEASRDNVVVEMSDLLLRLSSDFATKAIFGRSTESLLFDSKDSLDSKDNAAEFSEAANHAIHMLGQRGLMINLYWIIDSPQFRKSCRICKRFVDRYLLEAHQPQSDKPEPIGKQGGNTSFMQSLMAKGDVAPEVVRDQLLALVLASRDTSAAFASWVVYALSRNTRVLQKLRMLIERQLPNGQVPILADVNALPYLRHVLNETLRIYPVVPLDGRSAKVDTVLPEGGGEDGKSPLLVPANAKVGFNIYTLHHRHDIFGEDAEAFRPERWEDSKAGSDFGGAFVPFITGPRVCLGKSMAMMTVSYITIRILQNFDQIERVSPPASTAPDKNRNRWPSEATRYDMKDLETTFKLGLTMSARDGVYVRLRQASTK